MKLIVSTFLLSLLLSFSTQAYAQDGTLNTSLNSNVNNTVFAIAPQSNGDILIGGTFTSVLSETRNRIARVTSTGALDTTFAVVNVNDTVDVIAVQTDGKIILGGTFTMVNDTPRNGIARLDINGNLDMMFDPDLTSQGTIEVDAIALQMIGGVERILIGGSFDAVDANDIMRSNIARLDLNGSLDTSFTANTNGTVSAIGLDSNNRIFIGGGFTEVNDTERRIARLNINGSVDSNFDNPDLMFFGNPGGSAFTLAVQLDDKVVFGGLFDGAGTVTSNDLIRFNTDGSVDTSLNAITTANPAQRVINKITIQSNNRILIGGVFSNVNGVAGTAHLARLNPDGTVDESFTPDVGDNVFAIAIQADDDILVGGNFTNVGATSINQFARLNNNIVEVGFVDASLSQAEGNSGETNVFTFTAVSQDVPTDSMVSVDYVVEFDSATADDFAAGNELTGTLNFTSEQTIQSIPIEVAGDADVEQNETFTVTLSNPNPDDVSLTTAVAQGTILDDDDDDILCLPIPARNGNFAVVCL